MTTRAGLDLETLVRGHCAQFPWYARLLAERGLDPASPLAALPLVDEACLLEHYYTAPDDAFPGAETYLTSGTTTGVRKRIRYAADDHAAYLDHRRAILGEFLDEVPRGSVAVADLGTGHAAASAREIFSDLGFDARDIDFRAPIDDHVSRLNAWQPAVLFTMPMIMDRLLGTGRLDIAPRKVVVVGDLAPENWRRHVAARLGIGFVDVLDVFGSIEVGAIAYFCAGTGLYHFHEHLLAEVVPVSTVYPDATAELPAGSGLLLLTSFARRYFPALRFVTGDVVTGLRPLEWRGRVVQAFDRVESRYDGDLKHGERISQHDICAAVNAVLPGAMFEVATDHRLEIRVVADVTDEQVALIRAHLLAACPDVAQMVASGLVEPVAVTSIRPVDLRSGTSKRRYNVTVG